MAPFREHDCWKWCHYEHYHWRTKGLQGLVKALGLLVFSEAKCDIVNLDIWDEKTLTEASNASLYLQELAAYWQHDFDWRQSEARINSFHNYKLLVNGIDVHFIHERSPDSDALPLIFTHGWPGSFLESLKLIKLLTQPSMLLAHT